MTYDPKRSGIILFFRWRFSQRNSYLWMYSHNQRHSKVWTKSRFRGIVCVKGTKIMFILRLKVVNNHQRLYMRFEYISLEHNYSHTRRFDKYIILWYYNSRVRKNKYHQQLAKALSFIIWLNACKYRWCSILYYKRPS